MRQPADLKETKPIWFYIVSALVFLALCGWLFTGAVRVRSDRAASLREGLMPQRLVYRRLRRDTHARHGR
ncbi:hypothetical protein [Streptomyces sp. C36]|uniref:hypothetical protein n=1 Tax=Streptomyces sp. C36 TaxID=3237122 RepID=UPI0034C64992